MATLHSGGYPIVMATYTVIATYTEMATLYSIDSQDDIR